MADERTHCCLGNGTWLYLGTVGVDGVPSCIRAIALRSDDDLDTATVYVPLATSRETLANLAATHRVSVVATKPIEHTTVQLKGRYDSARLARDDEAPFVQAHVDGLADVLERIGIPRHVTRGFAHWPAFAIDMKVEQIFEQTPGPKAGTRLR